MAWTIQWSVALVVFLAVMAVAGYFVTMHALSGGQHVRVPNILDLPITEASYVLAEKGLEMGNQVQVPHQTVPKYHVITQRPEAGRVVRTGRKVIPTVSMGTRFMEAPDLTNMGLEDARRQITQARFRLGSVARVSDDTPRNTVLAQDPPPAGRLSSRGAIHLLVSAGSEKGRDFMPDIRGMGVQDMLNLLSDYNVTVVPNEVDIPNAREDVVLDQDPPPDTVIYAGQVVTYDVKPSGQVELPDMRHSADVRHVMPYDWYDKDVRVDLVDRRGNAQTVFVKPALTDQQSRQTYVAGTAISLKNITYVGEATVEVYVDDELQASYHLKGGEAPAQHSESTTL